jgi:hypothetical protein
MAKYGMRLPLFRRQIYMKDDLLLACSGSAWKIHGALGSAKSKPAAMPAKGDETCT